MTTHTEPEQIAIWVGPGYQIELLSDGTFRMEMWDSATVILPRPEFAGVIRQMIKAQKRGKEEFDEPEILTGWAARWTT